MTVSPQRRQDIIDALRRGTVPRQGLDALAVGLEAFEPTFTAEIDQMADDPQVALSPNYS